MAITLPSHLHPLPIVQSTLLRLEIPSLIFQIVEAGAMERTETIHLDGHL